MNRQIVIFLGSIFVIVVMLTVIATSGQSGVGKTSVDAAKEYSSRALSIAFQYPASYSLREQYNEIVLSRDTREIRMSLAGGAGQTTDAKTYMDTVAQRNSLIFQDVRPVKTSLYTGYAAAATAPGLPRTLHYFLSDGSGSILVITTQHAELADDVDSIIGSFRRPTP